MKDSSNVTKNDARDTKTVGGQIPAALYWEFKRIQAQRHESSTKALEIAVQLYCDAIPKNNNEEEH